MAEHATPPSHRIVFTPVGIEGRVTSGSTVLEAARQLGVDVDSVCGGRGICGRCQITPALGSFAKWSITASEASITPPGSIEHGYRGRRAIAEGNRLGCGTSVIGDLVVDVPTESQIHKQIVRKEADLGNVEIDPIYSLHFLDLNTSPTAKANASPTANANVNVNANVTSNVNTEDGTSATRRITQALAEQWDLRATTIEPHLLARVHDAVEAGQITVAVANRQRVVAIWVGYRDQAWGIALDIGSTTVAGHLCELATGDIVATTGRMNPQIRFGEDLMSRVSYAMMNEGGAEAMTAAIRGAVNELTHELLAIANTERSSGSDPGSDPDSDELAAISTDDVLDVVAVGNPIMHHLLAGIDPTPLGQAPFPLATAEPIDVTGPDLDLDLRRAAVHLAPCIAGHVGADTAAAILAEGPHRRDEVQLLVDVGTNAEIVLGNREQLFAASSPTGPAFEGAQISSGQRATVGAIERVRIDRVSLEPRFKVIGSEVWSDETDPEAAGTETPVPVTGICGSGIIEVMSELFLSGVIDARGVIVGSMSSRSDRIVAHERTFSYRLTDSIHITQADVRAVQLAKAALRAGIELLLEHAHFATVDEVRLAGAFGAHIDPFHAMVLGLIPDCRLDAVRSVGNAAGSGAVRALLSGRQRLEMADVARSVTKVETATEARFQDHFVAALAIPHQSAPTPYLSALVDLPAATEPTAARRRRRRRPEHG